MKTANTLPLRLQHDSAVLECSRTASALTMRSAKMAESGEESTFVEECVAADGLMDLTGNHETLLLYLGGATWIGARCCDRGSFRRMSLMDMHSVRDSCARRLKEARNTRISVMVLAALLGVAGLVSATQAASAIATPLDLGTAGS